MDGGMGPTLTLVLAGVLWLLYLAPSMRRKREFESTEKNAIRIQQALRAVAETTNIPDSVVTEISNREALIRQRERERIERRRETELKMRVRAESNFRPSLNIRTVKLALTGVSFLAVVAAAGFGVAALWVPTVVSAVVAGLTLVTLVLVNGSDGPQRETFGARPSSNVHDVADSWTPVRAPKVRATPIPESAGLVMTSETEREISARERAARIRQQAAAAAEAPEAAPDSRFTELGYDTGSTSALDINAALRARRAQ